MDTLEGEKVLWQNGPDDSRTNVILTEANSDGVVRLSLVDHGAVYCHIPMLGSKMLEMAEFIVKDAYGEGEAG